MGRPQYKKSSNGRGSPLLPFRAWLACRKIQQDLRSEKSQHRERWWPGKKKILCALFWAISIPGGISSCSCCWNHFISSGEEGERARERGVHLIKRIYCCLLCLLIHPISECAHTHNTSLQERETEMAREVEGDSETALFQYLRRTKH